MLIVKVPSIIQITAEQKMTVMMNLVSTILYHSRIGYYSQMSYKTVD